MIKRVISSLIGISLVIVIMILNNELIFNFAVTIIALIGLNEFYNAVKAKNIKPVEIIGYLSTTLLLIIGIVDNKILSIILTFMLPLILLILFFESIITNIKTNIVDISATILGICYVSLLFSFLILTKQTTNGNLYVWYIFGGAWATDIFAYLIGKNFGKHKFSAVSPNKSIEGCIGGLLGCIIFFIGYTYFLSTRGIVLNYIYIILLSIIVSVISQIGDFSASTIKRYCGIKDYGSVLPGHGGILDRFDSMLFISPIIYAYFNYLV
jgi:phosphatidate cytidylyltransferase